MISRVSILLLIRAFLRCYPFSECIVSVSNTAYTSLYLILSSTWNLSSTLLSCQVHIQTKIISKKMKVVSIYFNVSLVICCKTIDFPRQTRFMDSYVSCNVMRFLCYKPIELTYTHMCMLALCISLNYERPYIQIQIVS